MRATPDSPEVTPFNCTPAEIAWIKLIRNENVTTLVKALLSVHDTVLYHSNTELGKTERMELLYVRLLADALDEIKKEGR